VHAGTHARTHHRRARRARVHSQVSFARRHVHVQAVRSKQILMAGELQGPINPNLSTWTTDGQA
jgi:hypothetical protein